MDAIAGTAVRRDELYKTESSVVALSTSANARPVIEKFQRQETESKDHADSVAVAAAVAAGTVASLVANGTIASGEVPAMKRDPAGAAAALAAGAEPAASAAAEADDDVSRKEWETKFLALLNTITNTSGSSPGRTQTRGFGSNVTARLIVLSRKLFESNASSGLYRQAFFAAQLLSRSAENFQAVNEVIDDIEFSTSRNSPIYSVMRGLLKSVIVEFLLVGVVITAFSIPYVIFDLSEGFLVGTHKGTTSVAAFVDSCLKLWESPLVVSVVFGILGSVVSILLRLSEFEGATHKSRQFLTMTGAMLPLVGGVFAAVTCALFASGIINFQFANSGGEHIKLGIETPYFYVVIGFLAGFSERFTRGLLGRAEPLIAGAPQADVADNNGR